MRIPTGKFPAAVFSPLLLVACLAFGFGVAQTRAGVAADVIVIRGSDSLVPVIEKMARSYSSAEPGIKFDIDLISSTYGIRDLLLGRTDIAAASRPMSSNEQAAFVEKGLVVSETLAARLGITVVIHRSNPVNSVSMKQLAGIFSGQVVNWKTLGGPDQGIVVVRKETGWSPRYFQDRVMAGKPYLSGGVIVESKAVILNEVSLRLWAIGIVGMPEAIPALNRIKLLRVKSDVLEDESTYAFSRPMFLFSTSQASENVKAFLEYVSSSEAQDSIGATGFFPAHQRDSLDDPDE